MQEVEIGFKIKNSLKDSKRLLKRAGFKNLFNAETHDVYYTNRTLTPEMSEQEIKFSCVRMRMCNGGIAFHNCNVFDKSIENEFKCNKEKAKEFIALMESKGFVKVIDTLKTDSIWIRDKLCCQLQNIDNIGILNYIYDESIFNLSEEDQFLILTKIILDLGFDLEYPLGIDKLRTLLSGEFQFSQNQNGNYKECK